jgi:Protein-disulfide isomerase
MNNQKVFMNRRTLIIVTAVVAVGLFAIGGLLYSPTSKEVAVTKPVSNEAPLVRPHSPVFGAKDAPVTIVEFFDPACEACRAFHPVVKKILSEFQGKVRVVLRYTAFHPPSEEAIRILEAARLQGKFEVVLERLLETQPRWAPHGRPADSAWSLLDGTGLDVERARRDAKLPGIVAVLNQDTADVKNVGVTGTPTFFVNGKPLLDFGEQQLLDLVEAEVASN